MKRVCSLAMHLRYLSAPLVTIIIIIIIMIFTIIIMIIMFLFL